MNRRFVNVFLIVGSGFLVYGLTAYHGRGGIDGVVRAGWDTNGQLAMAIGAMLVIASVVFRRS